MADDDDLELDEGAAKKGGSKVKLIIILSVVGVLVLGGAVAATLYFTGAFSSHNATEQTNKAEKKAPKQAQYLPLDPPFVVNFEDNKTQIRFLQIAVEVMSRDATVLEAVKLHMPAIRNNLVILFSSQDAAAVSTREGKEQLRAATLSEINKILKKETGEAGLEAVYFTSFVMQ